jgi:hypothetical protein
MRQDARHPLAIDNGGPSNPQLEEAGKHIIERFWLVDHSNE